MKNTLAYHNAIQKLRQFFLDRKYIEVPVQSRQSILAACEDPETIATYEFAGKLWPLPQTGQMWLERELLLNADWPGVFCISTSYRNEPHPIEGRHDLIFPMFEFEGRGDVEDLIDMEMDLLKYLNIPYSLNPRTYDSLAKLYQTKELRPEHEEQIFTDCTVGIFITDFPEDSSPFWNMRRNEDGTTRKVDVILKGMETIGSAERETDPSKMRQRFHDISGGKYAHLLYKKFGVARVKEELEEYLALPMTPRFGGGMGLTRLARCLEVFSH